MKKYTRYLGLDVHSETIAVVVCDGGGGEVRYLGVIANSAEALRKLIKQLQVKENIKACYEGPCGYVVYEQLEALGVSCDVVAPTLIPQKSGDRVKTDRKDAEKLSRLLRSGELVAVHVPEEEQRALRDLLRARQAVKADQPQGAPPGMPCCVSGCGVRKKPKRGEPCI